MGGGSGKSDKKKSSEPIEVTVASNPNYIPVQQPQPFAPGMQQALAAQLASGFGSPRGLLGPSATAQDFNGLLTNIYSQEAMKVDPIGAMQQAAAQAAPQKPDWMTTGERPKTRDEIIAWARNR